MKRITAVLLEFICQGNNVNDESYKIYQYGLQAGLEMLSCFLCCFFIALKLEMPKEYLLFFGIFVSTRSYIGGIHMKNYWQCFIMSCSVFVLVLFLTKFYQIECLKSLFSILSSVFILYLFEYGVEMKDDISVEAKNYFRKKMNFIFGFWILVDFILYFFQYKSLLTLCVYVFV